MGISPHDGEQLIAEEIRRIYSEAELRVIEKIASALRRDVESQQWAQAKLRDLRRVKGEIDKEVIEFLKNSNPQVIEAIEKAYRKGQRSAELDLKELGQEIEVEGTFGQHNELAVRALARETVNKINSTHIRILRTADDIYRQVVAEASGSVITGAQTRLEASQRVLDKLANKGITGFVDASGRSWELSSYAEMAVRSGSGRAAINGMADRLAENNRDLVIISDHAEECELCRPWERRILSISGTSKKYPSLQEAIAAGLFHPNCAHTLNAYVRGLTRDVGNKNANADPEGYKIRQQQRYNERMIRKWKRRKAAALDEKAKRKANAKIREWQARQRKFVEEYGLRRKYEREQIKTAH